MHTIQIQNLKNFNLFHAHFHLFMFQNKRKKPPEFKHEWKIIPMKVKYTNSRFILTLPYLSLKFSTYKSLQKVPSFQLV